ncbi:MAG: HEPN domain-containing protein [Desulfurococcales archaeon]|nr:HEPN domain-containing protein [Desulfurococcales archaeon]
MSSRLYREFAARARHFLRASEFDVSEGRYDIALFHLEQAAQLAIKAYLLRELGDFPRIHSLRDLVEISGSECLKELAEERWYVIDILDDAYTGSRYFVRRYGEREYRAARQFVERVFQCIGI